MSPWRSSYPFRIISLMTISGILLAPRAGAGNIWDGGGGNNNWSTAANWDSDTAPLTSILLQFAGTVRLASNNNLTAGTQFNGIQFNSGAGAFTLGGNAINLGGDITNNSSNLQTINLGLTLTGTRNIATNGAGGDITLGGVIAGSGLGITKEGAGTLTLNGSAVNTYTGPTTVDGGTLLVDYANVVLTSNLIKSSSALNLGGGNLTAKGSLLSLGSQAFAGTTLTAGTVSQVQVVNPNLSLVTMSISLGALTRNAGSTLDLTAPNHITTTTTSAANSILTSAASSGVAYATANGGTTWATNASGTLGALATYSSTYTSANNVDVANGNSVSGVTVNSLRFNSASTGLTLAGTNVINTGGILITPTATGSTISGGTLTGNATNREVIVHDYATLGLGAIIADNSGATALTLTGPGTTTLSGANTFSGGTVINQGTVKAGMAQNGTTSGTFGSQNNSLTMAAGSTLNLNGFNVGVGTFAASGTSAGTTVVTNSSGTAATFTVGNNNSRWSALANGTTLSGNLTLVITGNNATSDNLTGPNTHTGGTTFTGNNTADGVANAAALGSGAITFGGVNGGGGFTIPSTGLSNWGAVTNAVVVTGTGNSWNFQNNSSGSNVTFTSANTWTGTGTLTLSNSFTPVMNWGGNMTGFQGTLIIQGSGASYNFANATNVGAGSATLDLQSVGANNLTVQYTGGGNATIAIGELNTTGNTGSGTITLRNSTNTTTATFQVGALNQSSTFAGIFTNGTGTNQITAVEKTGTGTWTLTGTSTHTGATTLTGGTISISTLGNGGTAGNLGAASSAAANLVFNGGTLKYTGATTSSDRAFTINAGKTATIQVTANTLTLSGASAATSGALAKTGSGTLILSGANAHTGGTTITGGTLTAANASALGTGSVLINGGSLTSMLASVSTGAITLDSGTLAANGTSAGDYTLGLNKSFAMSGGVLQLSLLSASSYDKILGSGGGSSFTLTGGTLDLTNSVTDYTAAYQVFGTGFNSGSVSGLTIINYDTAHYSATLGNDGEVRFITAVPEPHALWPAALTLLLARRRRPPTLLRCAP